MSVAANSRINMVELAARIAVLTPALFSLLLFKRERSFPECLLVFAEPSIPPLILRDDATLHHPPARPHEGGVCYATSPPRRPCLGCPPPGPGRLKLPQANGRIRL